MRRSIFYRATLLTLAFLLVGQGCIGNKGANTPAAKPVDLSIWRVFDGDDTFDTIITAYEKEHPNVNISYRKLRFEEYEGELVRALAEGRGPDIFSVHNTWIGEYEDLMSPMPPTVTISEYVTQGTLRRETRPVTKQKQTMSQKTLKEVFVDQVARDVIREYQANEDAERENRIFGLPMALDSLALFYNKDLLAEAGIANPPKTWGEFQEQVVALTAYDTQGEVARSGAAIGRADNVERYSDILSLLMMQNGTQMTDERGRITFQSMPEELAETRDTPPGLVALEYYTDFANESQEFYTWNESYKSSFEAFANGETAFFLGYSYHIPFLKASAPRLNYAITGAPQVDDGRVVNLANYWVESVAKASESKDWAWDFILFATSEEHVKSYLDEAKKPTARRALIESQLESEEIGVFAKQALTARHWYAGRDAGAMETAFADMINAMLLNPEKPLELLNNTARRVSQSY